MRIFRKLAQLLDVDLTTNAPADGDSLTYDSASSKWVPEAVSGGGGGGAPTDATYITQTANSDLENEQALSALSTGLVKVTNGTGVLSTATGGTDYANASHQHAGEDITSGTVADARIASTIARDSEVTSAIAALSSVYQAKDTTLDTYAGIDPSANVQSVLGAADYAAIRTLLGLVIGTNVQAFDADLTTWAGLTPSAFFQTLVDDTDAATARATLGVIASLFQSGGAQAIKLDDLAAPDDNTDLNVSTSKHGLAPKLPNDATKYLDGTGAYSVPAGGGGSVAAADVSVADAGSYFTATDVEAALQELAAPSTSTMLGYEAGSTSTIGSTNIFAVRVWLPRRATFTKFAFRIGTSSGNMDLGIYTAAGTAIRREGSFAVPATGRATRTLAGGALTLEAGEYILACQMDNSSATISIIATDHQHAIAYTPSNTFPLPSTMTLTVGGTGISLMLVP